jgi:Cys-rich repeat protein
MRLKRHLLPATALAILALALVLAPDASAQFGLSEAAKGTGIPTGTNVPAIIGRILRLALGFVGTLFLLLMVYAGFLWMTARGDSKKVDQAKGLITSAIIGVFLIGAAYAITALVIAAASGNTSVLDAGDEAIEICTSDADCPSGQTCQDIDPSSGDGTCR